MQNQSKATLEIEQPISLGFWKAMDDLIKLVRTYRVTAGLAERQRLADALLPPRQEHDHGESRQG